MDHATHLEPVVHRDWPAIGWEEQSWVPSVVWALSTDRPELRVPYRSAVPAAIAPLTPRPDVATLAAAEAAARELSRFDAEAGNGAPALRPLLVHAEAAVSSRIDDVVASASAIGAAGLGGRAGRAAELVVANAHALAASDGVSTAAIARAHATLMADEPRHTPGRWRSQPTWIGPRSDSPVGAEYVPPCPTRVPALMDDLVAFARRTDVSPLVSTAIAHAQFETVHPFSAGNGRVGRAFVHAMLTARGVTRDVVAPLSAGLLVDRPVYLDALEAYRAGDVSPIVAVFADAAHHAIANARLLVDDVARVRAAWSEHLTARRSSNAWALLDVLVRHPVLDSATAATALGVQQPNVYPPLQALVDAGVLTPKADHRQGPFWHATDLLAAIDRFAARAASGETT